MNWSFFLTHFRIALWQQRVRIALSLVTACIAIALVITFETPQFKTTWIVLLPGTERATSLSLDNLGEARSNGKNAYGSVSISPKNTYKEIALSDAVIAKAASEYKVEATAFSKPKIKLIDQTPAMQFTLKGVNAEELKQRATLYNDTFHAVLDRLRKNEIERNYSGVEDSLSEAKRRLSDAREAIVKYQNESSIVSETQFQAWLEEKEGLRREKSKVAIQLSSLTTSANAKLNQLGISPEQARAFLLVQASPATQQAMNMLSEKLAVESSMANIYGTENPLRKKITKEISGIRKHLAANLTPVPQLNNLGRPKLYGLLSKHSGEAIAEVNDLLAQAQGLDAQVSALKEQLLMTSKRIRTHTKEAAMLNELKRNHQIAEAIFSSALAKLDTSRLDIYATYPLTQLLTEPGGSITRDRIRTKLTVVAIILAFGLCVIALAFTRIRINIGLEQEA